MKKLALSIALAVSALFAMSTAASASIVDPGIGAGVTANGAIAIAGNVLTTTCSLTLNGTIVTTRLVRVNSGSGACGSGATIVLQGFPWQKNMILGTPGSGTWSLATIRATITLPFGLGVCEYNGSFGGTWSSDGIDTILEVRTPPTTLTLLTPPSAAICSTTPSISGSITLLGVASE